jgi:hypothetical protein
VTRTGRGVLGLRVSRTRDSAAHIVTVSESAVGCRESESRVPGLRLGQCAGGLGLEPGSVSVQALSLRVWAASEPAGVPSPAATF